MGHHMQHGQDVMKMCVARPSRHLHSAKTAVWALLWMVPACRAFSSSSSCRTTNRCSTPPFCNILSKYNHPLQPILRRKGLRPCRGMAVSLARSSPQQQQLHGALHRKVEITSPLIFGKKSTHNFSRASLSTCRFAVLAENSISVMAGLAVTVGLGWCSDRCIRDNTGILVTLLTAVLLSNAGLVPTVHPFYNLCWSTFVPASLVLMILPLSSSPPPSSPSTQPTQSATSASLIVRQMSIPFFIASISSILGCMASFFLCNITTRQQQSAWFSRLLLLQPTDALVATSCLAASFVGGTVNFFATGRYISDNFGGGAAATASTGAASSNTFSTVLSAMAAVDIIVMAVYFAFLGSALQSTTLKRWIEGGDDTDIFSGDKKNGMESKNSTSSSRNEKFISFATPSKITALVAVSTLALAVVQLANGVERILSKWVPGTACAVIASITPRISRAITKWIHTSRSSTFPLQDNGGKTSHSASSSLSLFLQRLWQDMLHLAKPLSEICFLFLFASLGMSADLSAAVQSGPACLIVSSLALFIHVILTLSVSKLVLRMARSWSSSNAASSSAAATSTWRTRRLYYLEDVLAASNAAIGGPATAAAFCSRMDNSNPRKVGLTLAATLWGVVGYAVGTTLGIAFFHVLKPFVSL